MWCPGVPLCASQEWARLAKQHDKALAGSDLSGDKAAARAAEAVAKLEALLGQSRVSGSRS